jgi:hypothetical protein
MVASFMQLKRHERGIHVVRTHARVVPQGLERFLRPGAPLHGASTPNVSALRRHERDIHGA